MVFTNASHFFLGLGQAHAYRIFGLCVGLCECSMCVTAAWAKTFLLIA